MIEMELPKQFDNITHRVIDDLKVTLCRGSKVSIAAASFSIYAFEALQKELETELEVVVYTKLPGGFYINTPVGHYNPDWAIVFQDSPDIKHVYFIAETKGYDKDQLTDYRQTESVKIECARRHFATISNSKVSYDVVKNYDELRNIITA